MTEKVKQYRVKSFEFQQVMPWDNSQSFTNVKVESWESSQSFTRQKVMVWDYSHDPGKQKVRSWDNSQRLTGQKGSRGITPMTPANKK